MGRSRRASTTARANFRRRPSSPTTSIRAAATRPSRRGAKHRRRDVVENDIITLGTTETFIFLPGGAPVQIVRTRWMWGKPHGPYTTDIPRDAFTAAELRSRQAALINELRQLP